MGTYSDQPDPPTYYQVVDTRDCVRYTDTAQAQWFIDRINHAYGSDTGARLDGDVVRWFGYYQLHIGDWLLNGTTPMTDAVLRASQLRPIISTFPEEG